MIHRDDGLKELKDALIKLSRRARVLFLRLRRIKLQEMNIYEPCRADDQFSLHSALMGKDVRL